MCTSYFNTQTVHTHWRRKWQPTPVFLPGESQGRRNLVGCCLWGRTELDMTEWLSSSSIHTHTHTHNFIFKILFNWRIKTLQYCDGFFYPSARIGHTRQEHWSGLPFPSPMHESEKWKWSRSFMSDSSRPHGLQPTRLLCLWDFPGKSTGVGCHCLLWNVLYFHIFKKIKRLIPYGKEHTHALRYELLAEVIGCMKSLLNYVFVQKIRRRGLIPAVRFALRNEQLQS